MKAFLRVPIRHIHPLWNNHHLLPFEGEDIKIFERDIPGFNEYGLSGQMFRDCRLRLARP